MSLLLLILLLPIFYLIYLLIKYRQQVLTVWRMQQLHKEQKARYEEEQKRQERVRRRAHPEQSSVELIEEAKLDLDGGEFVDYEEIEE